MSTDPTVKSALALPPLPAPPPANLNFSLPGSFPFSITWPDAFNAASVSFYLRVQLTAVAYVFISVVDAVGNTLQVLTATSPPSASVGTSIIPVTVAVPPPTGIVAPTTVSVTVTVVVAVPVNQFADFTLEQVS